MAFKKFILFSVPQMPPHLRRPGAGRGSGPNPEEFSHMRVSKMKQMGTYINIALHERGLHKVVVSTSDFALYRAVLILDFELLLK